MKYGETLRQRSVPQWAYQNVAYDSIKKLIKEHTTPGKLKAVPIPGQGDAVESSFEEELFEVLLQQHNNVNLFVRSKSGEIDRRLDSLGRQLHNLQLASWPPSITPTRIPPSRLAKYGRIEERALQAGEEIRLLSRFVIAQKTAFRKLLKKYKKWTGRTSLEGRWHSEVTNRPESFTSYDLTPFLDHWADLLQEIRFAMGLGQAKSGSSSETQSPAIQPMVPKQASTAVAKSINEAISTGSDVDFDSALSSTPMGLDGARAVYWVHPEQLVELHVLLLQYTRLAFPRTPPSTSSGSSSTLSIPRRSSPANIKRDYINQDPPVGTVILDNMEDFAHVQNSQPISDTEESFSIPPSIAAMTLRWTASSDLAVCLKSDLSLAQKHQVSAPARMKAKHLGAFLNLQQPFTTKASSGTESPVAYWSTSANDNRLQDARNWLSENRQIEPLVGISSRRTRFVNLPFGRDSGQWCVLDSDVVMKKITSQNLQGKDWPQQLRRDGLRFPYTVLSVRQEGSTKVDLIKILDETHLTERVRGFSFAAHALWTTRRPKDMTPPFWLPVLSNDIRKLPSPGKNGRKRRFSTKVSLPGQNLTDGDDLASSSTAVSTTGDTSSAVTPNDQSMSSRTRALRYAPGTAKGRPKAGDVKKQDTSRYWNEYDHPEDGSDDEGYFIYVNPDEDEAWFPFKDSTQAIYNKIKGMFSIQQKIISDPEREPLLYPKNTSTASACSASTTNDDYESSTSSSDDGFDTDILMPRTRYGALPVSQAIGGHGTGHDYVNTVIASIVSLFFATTLSVVLLVLSAVGRKRARGEIDIVVLAGSIISVGFAIMGLWGLVGRRAGLVRWIVAISVFVAVVVVDGLLIGKLLSDVQMERAGKQ